MSKKKADDVISVITGKTLLSGDICLVKRFVGDPSIGVSFIFIPRYIRL